MVEVSQRCHHGFPNGGAYVVLGHLLHLGVDGGLLLLGLLIWLHLNNSDLLGHLLPFFLGHRHDDHLLKISGSEGSARLGSDTRWWHQRQHVLGGVVKW